VAFLLTSTAFEEGQPIPREYTAEGQDISPPLKWPDPPEGTKSFALICEDPDAPQETFTHWVIFNMPGVAWELSADVPREEGLANGTRQGINDFGKIGYAGPAPPPGQTHRYVFTLYALDRLLDVQAACRKEQVLAATQDHILAEARLLGTYTQGQEHDLPDDPLEKKALQDRFGLSTAPLGE